MHYTAGHTCTTQQTMSPARCTVWSGLCNHTLSPTRHTPSTSIPVASKPHARSIASLVVCRCAWIVGCNAQCSGTHCRTTICMWAGQRLVSHYSIMVCRCCSACVVGTQPALCVSTSAGMDCPPQRHRAQQFTGWWW